MKTIVPGILAMIGMVVWGLPILAMAADRAAVGTSPQRDIAGGAPRLLAGQRVLWLGDSITQDGKYVSMVEYYLNKQFPHEKFDIISVGLASETLSGLSEKDHPFPRPCVLERLGRALDKVKPTTVVACYGINDGIYHPQSPERLAAFEDGVKKLSAMTRAAGAKLIVLTPPPFDALPVRNRLRKADAADFSYMAPFEDYDQVLAEYGRWERTLPAGTASVVVDLHSAMNDYLAQERKRTPGFSFTGDGIHPSAAGHLLMARTFLTAMGVRMESGDLDRALAAMDADPMFRLIWQRRELRSNGWLAYIGYTRDKTVRADTIEPTEARAAKLQAEIDILRTQAATVPAGVRQDAK